MPNYQYTTMEWLWDAGTIRVDSPTGTDQSKGMYPEVVQVLNRLGADGWEVCSCVANANWLFWTLKKIN